MRYLLCLLALLFASPLLADTIATCATENGPIVSGPTGCLSTGPLGDTASVHINQSLINTANNTIQYSLSASTVTQQVSEPICCAGTKDLATLEINQSYILSGSPAYFTYTYDLSAFSNYGSAVFSFTVGGVQYMCAGFCDPARLGFYFPMDGSGLSFDLSMEGYSTSFEASGYSMIGPGQSRSPFAIRTWIHYRSLLRQHPNHRPWGFACLALLSSSAPSRPKRDWLAKQLQSGRLISAPTEQAIRDSSMGVSLPQP